MKKKLPTIYDIQENIISKGISELTSDINVRAISRREFRIHKRALQLMRKKNRPETTKSGLYDMLVVYSNPNYKYVQKVLGEKLRPMDSTHAWLIGINMDKVNELKEKLKTCVVRINGEEFKIRICVYSHVDDNVPVKEVKKPTNNTQEKKIAAKVERKKQNIAHFEAQHERKEKRDAHKKTLVAKSHSCSKENNISSMERKARRNAKKAIAYLAKLEKPKAVVKRAKLKPKTNKQLMFNFKAAA